MALAAGTEVPGGTMTVSVTLSVIAITNADDFRIASHHARTGALVSVIPMPLVVWWTHRSRRAASSSISGLVVLVWLLQLADAFSIALRSRVVIVCFALSQMGDNKRLGSCVQVTRILSKT
jgi:hypothetical protein